MTQKQYITLLKLQASNPGPGTNILHIPGTGANQSGSSQTLIHRQFIIYLNSSLPNPHGQFARRQTNQRLSSARQDIKNAL